MKWGKSSTPCFIMVVVSTIKLKSFNHAFSYNLLYLFVDLKMPSINLSNVQSFDNHSLHFCFSMNMTIFSLLFVHMLNTCFFGSVAWRSSLTLPFSLSLCLGLCRVLHVDRARWCLLAYWYTFALCLHWWPLSNLTQQ